LDSPDDEVLVDFSLGLDSEGAGVGKTADDPSLWTPMEIVTATGNVDCMFVEHPLKLKSTYTQVEVNSMMLHLFFFYCFSLLIPLKLNLIGGRVIEEEVKR
jgi:hypothetical protein